MMLAVAVLFSATACSFRGEEITISRKLNQSEVFSIDGQSFRDEAFAVKQYESAW